MIDLHRKFQTALKDTVDEWKKRKQVSGIFTYGSVVKGTATASSDLDLAIVWDGEEAPARLMAEHKGVIVDMDFIPKSNIDKIPFYCYWRQLSLVCLTAYEPMIVRCGKRK